MTHIAPIPLSIPNPAPNTSANERAASPLPPHLTQAADAERTARHLATLRELSEIGLDLVRRLYRDETARPNPQTPSAERERRATARVVAGLTRAIRLNLALEARLASAHRTRLTRTAAAAKHAARARTEPPSGEIEARDAAAIENALVRCRSLARNHPDPILRDRLDTMRSSAPH